MQPTGAGTSGALGADAVRCMAAPRKWSSNRVCQRIRSKVPIDDWPLHCDRSAKVDTLYLEAPRVNRMQFVQQARSQRCAGDVLNWNWEQASDIEESNPGADLGRSCRGGCRPGGGAPWQRNLSGKRPLDECHRQRRRPITRQPPQQRLPSDGDSSRGCFQEVQEGPARPFPADQVLFSSARRLPSSPGPPVRSLTERSVAVASASSESARTAAGCLQ